MIEHLLNIQTDFWGSFLNIETFSNEAERDYGGGTPLRPQHLGKSINSINLLHLL